MPVHVHESEASTANPPVQPTHLTAKQQTIYEAARNAVETDPKATISSVAQKAGCAPSSVNTLAHRLGYLGWPDMRRHLASTTQEPASHPDHGNATYGELEAVRDLLLLNKDKAIFVHAIGDGDVASLYLARTLVVHGFCCLTYERQALLAQARLGRAGILFLFNESGIVLGDDARLAHELGYRVVGLTGMDHSPVARLSDIMVPLKSNKSRIPNYSPDFYCARAIVFIEMLQARLPYLYDESVEDDVTIMDYDCAVPHD